MSPSLSNCMIPLLLFQGLSGFSHDLSEYRYIKMDGAVYRVERRAYLDLVKRRPDLKISVASVYEYRRGLRKAMGCDLRVYLLADEFHTPMVDLSPYKGFDKEGLYGYVHVYRNVSLFKGGVGVWVPVHTQFLDWKKLPSGFQFGLSPREWRFNYGNVVEDKLTAEGEYRVSVTTWYRGFEELAVSSHAVFTWTPD